ncbi:Imm1 family immunity protein (plasmid) [Streptomyces canus]|uniref:Imm1 family immunity protein n=1 Tax=Streptomyces canus TaxID=58343 RepID=UPI002E2A2586|nr:Imm1 family immunity protein [Streptomyces canus]
MTEWRAEAYYQKGHAENRPLIHSEGDIDALIDALLEAPPFHNAAELHSLNRQLLPSGFPDHELLVGVDKKLQVGALEFMDQDGNVVTLGTSGGRGEVSYFIAGNMTEFPERSEIPIELVRRAVKEFLTSGGQRPTCVQWQVPESW